MNARTHTAQNHCNSIVAGDDQERCRPERSIALADPLPDVSPGSNAEALVKDRLAIVDLVVGGNQRCRSSARRRQQQHGRAQLERRQPAATLELGGRREGLPRFPGLAPETGQGR